MWPLNHLCLLTWNAGNTLREIASEKAGIFKVSDAWMIISVRDKLPTLCMESSVGGVSVLIASSDGCGRHVG